MSKIVDARDALDFTPRLAIPAKHKKGTLRTLDAIRELFGPKGEYWIQGEEEREETGRDGRDIVKYCLIGAAHKANGPYEGYAEAALALAMAEELGIEVDEVFDTEDTIVNGNDEYDRKFGTIAKVIRNAKKLVEKA